MFVLMRRPAKPYGRPGANSPVESLGFNRLPRHVRSFDVGGFSKDGSLIYLFFSLQRYGRLEGAFVTLFSRFWQRYLSATGDDELHAVVGPFFAFWGPRGRQSGAVPEARCRHSSEVVELCPCRPRSAETRSLLRERVLRCVNHQARVCDNGLPGFLHPGSRRLPARSSRSWPLAEGT
jgi:hypothetical protein